MADLHSEALLSILRRLTQAFSEPIEKKALVARILESAIQATQADRGSIFMAPEGAEPSPTLRSLIATGMGGAEIEVAADQGIVGHVFTSGEPLMTEDARQDERFLGSVDQKTQYFTESVLCVPIKTSDRRVIGVIEMLNSQRGKFEKSDLDVLEFLAVLANMALESRETKESLEKVRETLSEEREIRIQQPEAGWSDLLTESEHPVLRTLMVQLESWAKSDSSVLVEGESGTGKEVTARLIHQRSDRSHRAFVAVNCAAIPESLFEAELFGVVKGAATGTASRKGKIESAHQGTLFLDEMGELPLAVQAKLLRVLQDRRIPKVGSDDQGRQVDFRLICATNRDLAQMVKEGKFREDLYYRINVISVRLPPLRERVSDFQKLCVSILRRFEVERGWKAKKIDAQALRRLQAFPWPGNLRQLQNRLEAAQISSGDRMVLVEADFVELANFPVAAPNVVPLRPTGDLHMGRALESLERQMIHQALEKSGGNRSQAARLLGLSREGLRKAMIRLGLEASRQKKAA